MIAPIEPTRAVRHKVIGMAANAIDVLGLDPVEVMDPFSYGIEYLRDRSAAIDWDDFACIVERITERVGLDRFRIAVRDVSRITTDLRVVFAAFVDPVRLYRFVNEVISPEMYPMLIGEPWFKPDRTLGFTITLRDGFRDCYPFFVLAAEMQAALPSFIGLPHSEVRFESSARHGSYWIRPPASSTLVSRLARGMRRLFTRRAIMEMEADKRLILEMYDQLRAESDTGRSPDPVDAAAQSWGLTARQREVLAGLVRGLSNKDLASELDCSVKTVEAHVTKVLRRAHVDSRAALVAGFVGSGSRPRS